MVNTVLELLVAPALVGAATLAARRWGQEIGGLVSAFPAIVGPVLLVAALEHGATFAARAASGTLLGLVALATFAVAYGWTAARAGWRGSLAAGWAVAGLAGLLVGAIAAGPPGALAAAAVSLGAAHRLLRHAAGRAHPPRRADGTTRALGSAPGDRDPAVGDPGAPRGGEPLVPRWDLQLRMALTALLVVTLTAAASRFGAIVGGVLAALPVLASILAVFTHARYGAAAVVDLLRGMLGGMAGFVAFCALVAVLVEPLGIAASFAVATVSALAIQGATAWAARPASATPAHATAARA
jgi:hypothetical protein